MRRAPEVIRTRAFRQLHARATRCVRVGIFLALVLVFAFALFFLVVVAAFGYILIAIQRLDLLVQPCEQRARSGISCMGEED